MKYILLNTFYHLQYLHEHINYSGTKKALNMKKKKGFEMLQTHQTVVIIKMIQKAKKIRKTYQYKTETEMHFSISIMLPKTHLQSLLNHLKQNQKL